MVNLALETFGGIPNWMMIVYSDAKLITTAAVQSSSKDGMFS